MAFPSTQDLPPLQTVTIRLFPQCQNLLGSSSSQTGDIPINDQHKGNDRDDVGEEEVAGRTPEIEWREEEEQGAHEYHDKEGRKCAFLQLEYSASRPLDHE